jgi:dTDP-4-dehydrorhamnose 3,5-epimerase
MKFTKTPIKDAYIVNLETIEDDRGFFARLFCQKEFKEKKLINNFVQINDSFTKKKGTIRGMHYQKKPKQEVKIVRCISGKIFDVIIDLRKTSQTYLNWYGLELSSQNKKMLYVPNGCAHGFLTLSNNCEVFYLVSQEYSPKHEMGLRFDDPKINIKWPLKILYGSDKDMNWEKYK